MKRPRSADEGRPQRTLRVSQVHGGVSRWKDGFVCYLERVLEKQVLCLLTVAITTGRS